MKLFKREPAVLIGVAIGVLTAAQGAFTTGQFNLYAFIGPLTGVVARFFVTPAARPGV